MTLLEKARQSSPPSKRLSVPQLDERLELALAYCRGEVSLKQAAEAMGTSQPNGYQRLSRAMFSSVAAGKLRVEVVP